MSNATIGWLLVLAAGGLEVLWPVIMKQSHGLTRLGWVAVMMLAMCASFGLLSLAVSKRYGLPIGTAYAVWTGMGAAGAGVLGILLFKEPSDFWRLLFLAMVVAGIVGLKFTHREPPPGQPTEAAAEHVESRG